MHIIDITPEIDSHLAVWPGDTPYQRDSILDFERNDSLRLGWMKFSGHLGAHADGPSHYHAEGGGIGTRDLQHYLGPCQVIRVQVAEGARIYPEDVKEPIRQPRVLFRTGSAPDPRQWNPLFNSLSPELIVMLHQKGVTLVGIDTPSIDPQDCKTMDTHKTIHAFDMAVLESLFLEKVEPGEFTLIALPLKIMDGDASPVRAVLLPLNLLPS